jgi:CBS domain-containing protein
MSTEHARFTPASSLFFESANLPAIHKFFTFSATLYESALKKPHRKHSVILPNLKQILNLLTVDAIMTPKQRFYCVHPQQTVSEAEEILRNYKFSGAPLKEEQIHRYVRLDTLTKNLGFHKTCEHVAEEIGFAEMITENTTIEDVIGILALREDSSPLFVTSNNSIVGLVTAADLDKIPVKVYFFTLISALESLLLDIIGKNYHKYKSLLDNSRRLEGRFRLCAGEKVGLEEYNYLMTPEILEIVSKSEIREKMRIVDDSELKELEKFRNNIAHGNYIIVKDSDVKKLKQRQTQIYKYIQALEQSEIETTSLQPIFSITS